MGFTGMQIARELNVSVREVRRYLAEADALLAMEALPALASRIRRSVSVFQMVEQAAWAIVHDRNLPNNSMARTAALNQITMARQAIDRLQGTDAPESKTTAALAQFNELFMEELAAESPEFAGRLMARLAARVGNTSLAPLLGAPDEAVDSMPWGEPEASDTNDEEDGLASGDADDVDGMVDAADDEADDTSG